MIYIHINQSSEEKALIQRTKGIYGRQQTFFHFIFSKYKLNNLFLGDNNCFLKITSLENRQKQIFIDHCHYMTIAGLKVVSDWKI